MNQSIITCPKCGYKQAEQMPVGYCQYFYDCRNRGAVLKPKKGDCCVYCSFGSVPCPPVQKTGR
ncbi:MAG: GDCCVxC domain-containing (seleno)protein [Rhodospirillales bacterium]